MGVVREKESSWDGKQAPLTGEPGQVVGFDEQGRPTPQAEGVPKTRTVNGKPLEEDISLTAEDVGAAMTGHRHSAEDAGARPSTWMPTAEEVGAVPAGRSINGKSLSEDITLTADDVGTVPNVEKELPTAKYKVDRLSELAGHDVVFILRALPYGKTHDLARFTQDADVNILLAGCAEPDLKDPRLMEKFGGATPAEAVKRMLLPGEIADLGMAVEKLSGYRRVTITEVKNG